MSRPPLEVADLIRTAGAAFIERNRQWIRWKHVKVLLAIARIVSTCPGSPFIRRADSSRVGVGAFEDV